MAHLQQNSMAYLPTNLEIFRPTFIGHWHHFRRDFALDLMAHLLPNSMADLPTNLELFRPNFHWPFERLRFGFHG